jgi:hypothetical protein
MNESNSNCENNEFDKYIVEAHNGVLGGGFGGIARGFAAFPAANK